MDNVSLWIGVLLGIALISLFSYGFSRQKPTLAFVIPGITVAFGLLAMVLTRILLIGWSAIALALLGLYLVAVGTLSFIPALVFYLRTIKKTTQH